MDYWSIFSLLAIVLMIAIVTLVVVLFVKFLRYLDRKLVAKKSSSAVGNSVDTNGHQSTKSGSPGCIGFVLLITAIAIIPTQLNYLRGRYVSRNWASVTGRVITSDVERGQGSLDEESFCLDVTYQYVVNELSYSGTTIRFGSRCYNDYGKTQREVDLYPEGEDVLIYFNPAKPKESVLEPGGKLSGPIFQILFSLVIGVVGLLFVVIPLREKFNR